MTGTHMWEELQFSGRVLFSLYWIYGPEISRRAVSGSGGFFGSWFFSLEFVKEEYCTTDNDNQTD